MSANFTPSQQAIKDLKPFRFWCQKVLPTVYDDSLSYYELLTKVVNYLNDTIDNVEALNDNVQNIYDAYILLQDYVNNYFDQNIPQIVSDKIDEMAEDGTLTALIKAYIDPYFDEKSAEITTAFEAQNDRITHSVNSQNETISEAISEQNSTISEAISEQNSDIAVMQSQLSTFISDYADTSDVGSEVADIRVGADSTVYTTAGDAVRGQVNDLQINIDANRELIGTFNTRNLIHYLLPFYWVENKQRDTTGTVVDRTGWMTSVGTIPITPDKRYYTNADVFVYYDENDDYVQTQDRAEGSTSIKVPNNADISYAYVNMKSVSNGKSLYVVAEETGYTSTWLIAHAMDYTVTPNENIVDSTDDNLLFRNLPMIQFSESALFSKRLTANMTGEKITQDFLNDRYGSMGITGYSNHDGTVIYHNGKLYSIFSSYTGNGDAANNSACRVVLVKIDEATHVKDAEIVVAKNGDIHSTYTQDGGAGSPNAYLVGSTIHILYTALINSAYMMMHCTYDISTGTLGNYSPVQVDGSILNNAWFNNRYGYSFSAGAYQYSQANSSIATDGNGTYYIGWCFGYGSYGVGVIFYTIDFINWTVFYDYSNWDVAPRYELALAYKSSHVYFCIRPDDSVVNKNKNCAFGNYSDLGIVGKVAVSDGVLKDAVRVYNCGSRPAFFTLGNDVYLFTNPYDRSHGQIIKVNTSILAESEIVAEFVGGYSYPSFYVDGTTIYTLVSDNFMRLSKFTMPSITESAVQTALYSVLNI